MKVSDMFKFEIGARVKITMSGETGTVIARADYRDACDAYLVLYRAADGRAVSVWWNDPDLEADESINRVVSSGEAGVDARHP